MIVVAIDIDGVLADFALAFTRLARELIDDNLPVYGHGGAQQWSFKPTLGKFNNKLFDHVEASETFWVRVPVLATEADKEALHKLSKLAVLVYLTGRRGTNVKAQTIEWLFRHDFPGPHDDPRRVELQSNAVFLSNDLGGKLSGLRKLGARAFLEDNPEELETIASEAKNLNLELFRRHWKYNQHSPGRPVYSVEEFCLTVISELIQGP